MTNDEFMARMKAVTTPERFAEIEEIMSAEQPPELSQPTEETTPESKSKKGKITDENCAASA